MRSVPAKITGERWKAAGAVTTDRVMGTRLLAVWRQASPSTPPRLGRADEGAVVAPARGSGMIPAPRRGPSTPRRGPAFEDRRTDAVVAFLRKLTDARDGPMLDAVPPPLRRRDRTTSAAPRPAGTPDAAMP